jgi:hypothetical protein
LQCRLESIGDSLGVNIFADEEEGEDDEPPTKKVRSFEQDMNDSELTFDELFDLNAASGTE